jgi:hypothetical protein
LKAGQVITPSTEDIVVINGYDFGEPPFILTLTTALDYLTLKEAERIYVESRDTNEAETTFHVKRGWDGSTAKDWTPTESLPVYTFMLFTTGYYDELRDAISFLENKPIVLEMSNVDLDIASVLTHKISVSDGMNEAAGWNVAYSYNDGAYAITINTTSTLDQYSGRLRFYSTNNIRLDADEAINLYADGEINLIGSDIWLNTIFQVEPNLVRTIGIVEHDYLVNFMRGLKLADQDIDNPEAGMIRFVESGSPGFWGYYGGEWHKLGYTAQILI